LTAESSIQGKAPRRAAFRDSSVAGQCTSSKTQAAVAGGVSREFELLLHAPYSLDLAPFDFFLFPKLKSEFCSLYFRSDIIHAIEIYIVETLVSQFWPRWEFFD
jgi:hypothetical protein